MKSKEYLYVIDYCAPGIFEKELTEEDSELDTDEILEKYNVNVNNCHYLISSEKLEISQL